MRIWWWFAIDIFVVVPVTIVVDERDGEPVLEVGGVSGDA